MRVLITGSTSFIGRALVKELSARGHQLGLCVRPESKKIPDEWRTNQKITLIETQIEDFGSDSFEAKLKSFNPDAAVHLAWDYCAKSDRNHRGHFEVNLIQTLNLVRALSKTSCRYFLGLGSQAEYGVQNRLLTSELAPRPETAYGMSKWFAGLATEKLCQELEIGHCWLRLIAAYGPGEEPIHFVPFAVNKVLAHEPLEMTAGEQLWDYLYIDDCAEALASCLEKRVSGIYPLGSGTATSLKQIAEFLHRNVPGAPAPQLGRRPYAPNEIFDIRADVSELCMKSGWRPQVSIEDGLLRCLKQSHPS